MPDRAQRESWSVGAITDARGRKVTQLDPVLLHVSRRHDAIPPEPLASIAGEVGLGLTRANRVLLWGTIVGAASLGIASTLLITRYLSGSISVGRAVRNLIPFACIWVTPMGLWLGTRGVRFQRTLEVMLRHRRCPHCGYDLGGSPIDPSDGATVCAECGCAWRLDGIDRD